MYERETGKDGDWVGDDAFDNLDDLCKFSGVEDADDIDLFDVYTCCYKVFDDEEDKEYFENPGFIHPTNSLLSSFSKIVTISS